MRVLECEFEISQIVYLKTDEQQKKRIVRQILFNNLGVDYLLSCGTEQTWHSEFEISLEQNILSKVGM